MMVMMIVYMVERDIYSITFDKQQTATAAIDLELADLAKHDGHLDRWTDRPTDGQTDGWIDRWTDGCTLLQRCMDASKEKNGGKY